MSKVSKFIPVVFAGLASLSVTGCGGTLTDSASKSFTNKPVIVTTQSLAPDVTTKRSPVIQRAFGNPSTPSAAKSKPERVEASSDEAEEAAEGTTQVAKTNRGNRGEFRRTGSQTPPAGSDKPATDKPATEKPAEKTEEKPATPPAATETTTSTPATAPAPASSASTSTSGTKNPYAYTFSANGGIAGGNFKKANPVSGLPSWFGDNDKDGDGQVAMSEWSDKELDEFKKYDQNSDGIITMQEAMRSMGKSLNTTATASTTSSSSTTTTPAASTPATTSGSSSTSTSSTASATRPGGGMSFNLFGGSRRDAATPGKDGGNGGGGRGNGGGGANFSFGGGNNGGGSEEDRMKRRVDMTLQFSDANKDGFMDDAEFKKSNSLASVEWKKYDKNRDNKLDKDELTAMYKGEGDKIGRGGPGGMGGGGRGGMFGGDPDQMNKTMFDNMDKKRKTGKIAKDDFPSFLTNRVSFEEWDTNKDKEVDFEEYKKGMEKFRSGMGGGGAGGGGDRGERRRGGGG